MSPISCFICSRAFSSSVILSSRCAIVAQLSDVYWTSSNLVSSTWQGYVCDFTSHTNSWREPGSDPVIISYKIFILQFTIHYLIHIRNNHRVTLCQVFCEQGNKSAKFHRERGRGRGPKSLSERSHSAVKDVEDRIKNIVRSPIYDFLKIVICV